MNTDLSYNSRRTSALTAASVSPSGVPVLPAIISTTVSVRPQVSSLSRIDLVDHGEPNYSDCPANLRRRNTTLEGELMNAKDELEGMRAALAVGEGDGNPLASKVAALEELVATKAQLNRAKAQLIAVKRNNAELEEEMDALLEIVADLKEQLDQDL